MFLFITDMPTMSPATPTTDGGSSAAGSVPKWVYALAIGVPVAAALAYILFGPATDSDVQSKKAKKSKPKADAVENAFTSGCAGVSGQDARTEPFTSALPMF